MPYAPARLCRSPGCSGTIRGGKCSRCGPIARTGFGHTTSSTKRGYGSDWVRIRKAFIDATFNAAYQDAREGPTCSVCGDVIRNKHGVHVDHKIPFSDLADPLRTDWYNLDLLHPACHMAKTRKQHK